MPVYEYFCEEHGPFVEMRPMAQSADPCACPSCGEEKPRAFFTAPALGASDRGRMKAHAVNERAADSPKKASTHGPGCACCAGGESKSRKTLHRPDGSKSFPSNRPWMISH